MANKQWIWFVAIAVGIILIANGTINLGGLFGDKDVVPPVIPGSEGCNIVPSVTQSLTDKLTPGTAITESSSEWRLNGAYLGTTEPSSVGTVDVIFINNTGYLSELVTGFQTECGAKPLIATMYANTSASLTYYSDNGLSALTWQTSNETAKAAALTYNWNLHFQGVDKKATGKQMFIVELSVPANVSSATLGGLTPITVPNGYSRQLTNGYVSAWILPSIVGNTAVDYNLAVTAATAKVIDGNVYTTIYNMQPFVETDGTFNAGDKAFNSLNTAKYGSSHTKNFIIV